MESENQDSAYKDWCEELEGQGEDEQGEDEQGEDAEQDGESLGCEAREVEHLIEDFILAFVSDLVETGAPPCIPVGERQDSRGEVKEAFRDVFARQGAQAQAYARVTAVLDLSHDLLHSGCLSAQRDLYYRLKGEEIFDTPAHVNQAIQDVAGLLQVTRRELNIVCSSRGIYTGNLEVQQYPGGPWLPCSPQLVAQTIPGDCRAIARYNFCSAAKYVVVVEKDAILQRLKDGGFCTNSNAILVTAKGMPDLATRAFLYRLLICLPHLQLLGLADWNPSGVAILSVYKHGSFKSREGRRFLQPALKWLGARAPQLVGVNESSLQGPLTARDLSLSARLRACDFLDPEWAEELLCMEEMNAKAELEALYDLHGVEGFSRLFEKALEAEAHREEGMDE